MRAEKAQMEACCEENAKSKEQIEELTNKVASLLSSNEQTKTELEQVYFTPLYAVLPASKSTQQCSYHCSCQLLHNEEVCGGKKCAQVNHEKEARLATALEQAAKNAEQITCLTAHLKELEFDKVLLALIDMLCAMQFLALSIEDS